MPGYRKKMIVMSVFLVLLLLLEGGAIFLVYRAATVERSARVLPSYPQCDISAVLARGSDTWTEDDLLLLSQQTGILSYDALRGESAERLAEFQRALYFRGETVHEEIAAYTRHDVLYDVRADGYFTAPMVALEPGDVLVSSTCHTFGLRLGHAALVVDDSAHLLQSIAPGHPSHISEPNDPNAVPWFCHATNFMVLRLKGASAEERKRIAEAARDTLNEVPYSLFVGIFMKKDQGTSPRATQCAHLVWQAFRNFGYDVDANGGGLVIPRDLARSDLFEIVQVYGFDPLRGW